MKRLTLFLTVKAPFLFTGLHGPRFGVDAGAVRDASNTPIIPERQVKGVLRHVIQAMEDAGAKWGPGLSVLELFGGGANDSFARSDDNTGNFARSDDNTGNWRPNRGVLQFDDLRLETDLPEEPQEPRTRIKVDEMTGSVETGALQSIATLFPVGTEVCFKGDIRYGGTADIADLKQLFERAFDFIPAIGAIKTSGFGRVTQAVFKEASLEEDAATTSPAPVIDRSASHYHYNLTLTLDRPFLVNAEKYRGNVLKGSEVIPGAAVKGALADKIKTTDPALYQQLTDLIDRVHIHHAMPVPEARYRDDAPQASRPHTVPLYLGYVPHEVVDMWSDPGLLELGMSVPGFAILPGLKDEIKGEITKAFGDHRDLRRETRTRTAISDKDGTAATSMLYTTELVVPDGHVWVASLAFTPTSPEDRDGFEKLLGQLSGILPAIGRARANARTTLSTIPHRTPEHDDQGAYRIVLQTDAALTDLAALRAAAAADPAQWVRNHYEAYWQSALERWQQDRPEHSDIQIDWGGFDVLAQQKWAGGYLAERYQYNDNSYFPYLLTQAGSAFRLVLSGKDSETWLRHLEIFGLPCAAGFDDHWKTFPFSPRCGYGEIKVETHVPEIKEAT